MASRERAVETLLSAALGLAWSFRVELTAIAALASASVAAVRYLGPVAGSLAVVAPLAAVAAWPTARRWAWRKLRHASIRRRYLAAVRVAGFDRLKLDRAPSVVKVRDTPGGYSLQVRLPAGTSSTDLDNTAEVTAAAMGVSDIRVARDPRRASLATVSVVQRDALSGPPLAWPPAGSPWWSLWEPIPVGLDENGDTVAVSLPEHNVLLGGEPGAGKSAALSLLVAASALDPTVTLWLLDGKRVELAVWEPCATRLVGPDLAEAIDVLDHLRAEMDARYAQLLAWKRRKVSVEDGLGLHVVVVDELALYLATGDRKTRDRLAESLRDLIARGRAAGVIVLAATQRPSSDIVPTSVRDLFGFRWAMRCATRDSSDTILGAGWAAEGYSASDIDPANRGVGYLLHEGGTPVRMRAAYLDDTALNAIAARAASIRRNGAT